jgi:hypothetical protein
MREGEEGRRERLGREGLVKEDTFANFYVER